MITGYQSKKYANSLEEFGEIKTLPYSQAFVIKNNEKLESLYSLFCPRFFNSSTLCNDIAILQTDKRVKALHLYTDPLLNINLINLNEIFDEVVIDKECYIINFNEPLVFSHNSWDNVRNFARSGYSVEQRTLNPINRYDYANLFYDLYKKLIKRNSITGIACFSESSFRKQLEVPGLVIFEVKDKRSGLPVAIRSFYIHDNKAYYHLAAQSHKAYGISASHAIVYEAIMHFKQLGLDHLVLGGAIKGSSKTGLASFKAGWANETKNSLYLRKELC